MTNSPTPHLAVLVADSDTNALSAVRASLEWTGLVLIEARTAAEVLELFDLHKPALVISELELPDQSGFSLCRQLRARQSMVRVMVVSRWAEEADRILAFECGADDFLAKPFFPRELASRTRVLLRGSQSFEFETSPQRTDETLGADEGIEIDSQLREVHVSGKRLDFTPREFSLLQKLIDGRGRVFSRAELIGDSVGELPAPGIRSVDAHIKSIRRKLGKLGQSIVTIRGIGYRYTGLEDRRARLYD